MVRNPDHYDITFMYIEKLNRIYVLLSKWAHTLQLIYKLHNIKIGNNVYSFMTSSFSSFNIKMKKTNTIIFQS